MLVSSVPQLEVKSHISKWCRYESCMEHFFLFSSPLLTLQCVYVTIAFVPAHPGIHWMLLLKYLEQLESTLRELSIFHLWPNTPLVLPNAENDVIVLRSPKLASSMVPTSFPLPPPIASQSHTLWYTMYLLSPATCSGPIIFFQGPNGTFLAGLAFILLDKLIL